MTTALRAFFYLERRKIGRYWATTALLYALAPVVLFVSFTLPFRGFTGWDSGAFVSWSIPGLAVVAGSLVGLVRAAYAARYLMSNHTLLDVYRTTPLNVSQLVGGLIIPAALVAVLEYILALILLAILDSWWPGTGLVLVVVILGIPPILFFTGLGLLLGTTVRQDQMLPFLTFILPMFLFLVGGYIVPMDGFPALMAQLSRYLPTTASMSAIHGLFVEFPAFAIGKTIYGVAGVLVITALGYNAVRSRAAGT